MYIEIKSTRVPLDQRNSKLHYYGIRHGSNWGKPETLERTVIVDFWGTLICTVCLDELFKKSDYFSLKGKHRVVLYQHCDSGESFDGKLLFPNLHGGGK